MQSSTAERGIDLLPDQGGEGVSGNGADLLAQCNDNVYGLASGIWTRDYKTAWRIGSALQTGTVWVNTYKMFSVSTPFGGVKLSGTGREKGRLGILEYTSQKSFYWGLNESPMPWATS